MTEISQKEKRKEFIDPEHHPWVRLHAEGEGYWNGFMRQFIGEGRWGEILAQVPEDHVCKNIMRLTKPLDSEKYKKELELLGFNERYNRAKVTIDVSDLERGTFTFQYFVLPFPFVCKDVNFWEGDFRDAVFSHITFESVEIVHDINFQNSIFLGNFNINKATAKGEIRLDNSVFHDQVNIIDKKFYNVVSFSNCKFLKGSSFSESEFHQYVDFTGAKFKGRKTDFHKTVFKNRVSFNEAEFNGHAFFKNSKFYCEEFDEYDDTLPLSPSFLGTKFITSADFSETEFFAPPHFEGAEFKAVSFNKAIVKNHNNKALHLANSAWAALISHMEKVNNFSQKLIFHEKLLEVDKEYEASRSLKILYEIYEKLGHGRLMAPPLIALAYTSVFFNWLYGLFYPSKAFGYTLVNTLSFISYYRSEASDYLDNIGSLRHLLLTAGGIHSVISLFLLFLIGLALRNRFKLK